MSFSLDYHSSISICPIYKPFYLDYCSNFLTLPLFLFNISLFPIHLPFLCLFFLHSFILKFSRCIFPQLDVVKITIQWAFYFHSPKRHKKGKNKFPTFSPKNELETVKKENWKKNPQWQRIFRSRVIFSWYFHVTYFSSNETNWNFSQTFKFNPSFFVSKIFLV